MFFFVYTALWNNFNMCTMNKLNSADNKCIKILFLARGVTKVLLKCYMNFICQTLILYCMMVLQLLHVGICDVHVRTASLHICCVLFPNCL